MTRLSIIVAVLNSHEVVRRQVRHFAQMPVPDGVEILYLDDGSDPPLVNPGTVPALQIIPTHDTRPWTWAVARNHGARLAQGAYLLMTDLDYIIPRPALMDALAFAGDYMGFRREFGILDEQGQFTQDLDTLRAYGLSAARIATRGVQMPPHPNNFVIRRDLFLEMGGYREDRVGRPYPQGEDNLFKKQRIAFREAGRLTESIDRPTLYMFPNGQYCEGGDVDANPFGLFHDLSRKTAANYWYVHPRGAHAGA
jgi:glycosyltransferase involved in cell wall biosynthesis